MSDNDKIELRLKIYKMLRSNKIRIKISEKSICSSCALIILPLVLASSHQPGRCNYTVVI